MEKVITILKEDILTSNYTDWKRCPITKALQRAGIQAVHGGFTHVLDKKNGNAVGVLDKSVSETVLLMYGCMDNSLEVGQGMLPADFSTKVKIFKL